MTDSGSKHGPRKDDALKKQVRGEVQANRANRAEEWLEPEPPGDDQPEATWPLAGRSGTLAPGADELQLRSDLARHLDRAAFPATKEQLLASMSAHHAPQQLLDLMASLPQDRTFINVAAVAGALGLPTEARN